MESEVAVFFVGTVVGIVFGLYVGQLKLTKYIENDRKFGGQPQQAEVWLPDMDTPVLSKPKLVIDEKNDGDVSWSPETIEAGTQELLREYQARGIGITPEQARQEVVLMLNAQGGEIEPVN